MMFRYPFGFNRHKCPGPDMQCEIKLLNVFASKRLQ